jgi:sugar/nucleoside kinase (ribokinase family)
VETVSNSVDVTVIGEAVMDVLAGAVGPEVFEIGSVPMDYIQTTFGGDALNEAVVLARLGKKSELITRLGCDDAGKRTAQFLAENGVVTERIKISDEYPSSVNIVLVDKAGERYFLTDPKSCLRKLSEDDITPHIDEMADIVSFASIFVSPLLGIDELLRVFSKIKEPASGKKRVLLTDVTKPKKGETLKDIACLLPHIDYFLANEDEISMLSGEKDAAENARRFIDEGASCVVIKRGKRGCLIRTANDMLEIPVFPGCKVVDSTGAGDSFAAGFLYGLSEGFSLEDCGKFACATASCIVEKVGGSAGIESADEPIRRFRSM